VRRAGATFTASANYLAPAVALGFGTLLLGEHPSPWTLAAFALICAGLWLAHHRRSDPVSG
jgi:drug/metabolite transporter (DMT)-like permease